MRNARAAVLVGLVVVGGAVSFIAMYSITRLGFSEEQGTYKTWALFEDVSGMGPGTKVTVAGVQVGEVQSIGISESSPNLARVDLILREDVVLKEGIEIDGKWKNGATLTRKSASLLGDQYLELTRGLEGPTLGNGDRIRNTISLSGLDRVMKEMERTGGLVDRMETIFEKLDGIASDVKAVTGTARNILGGPKGEKRLDDIANNVQHATRNLTEVATEVRGFTRDVRTFMDNSVLGRGEQVGRIVTNVERFTENAARLSADATESAGQILADVKVVTGDVRRLISGSKGNVESSLGTITGTLKSLQGTLERLDGALDNVKSITAKIDQGQGTLGRLVNDEKVIDSIEETVTDAGTLVKQVTGLETRVELASQYYFEQRALKNYVRLRLQPKHDKYYLIEVIDDPRGNTRLSSTITESNDPNKPAVVRETTSTTSDELKFSFQFAKRWEFMTGRFGIIESSGGIGVDAEFFKDSLKFSVDLFDFSADASPRMRILANYTFLKHFEIAAGVDDIFNEERFDWFLGIGLRFTDDDLKALLTVAPTPGG